MHLEAGDGRTAIVARIEDGTELPGLLDAVAAPRLARAGLTAVDD
jgi:hypothetical protein